jgi:hypothetical protein
MRTAAVVVLALLAATGAGCGATPPEAALRAEFFQSARHEELPRHLSGDWTLLADGALALRAPFASSDPGVLPLDGGRFRAVAEDVRTGRWVALTDRGRLHRIWGSEMEEVGVRAQPGSRLAAGTARTWIAGEAGGLFGLPSEGRSLVTHWETGDPPVTALAARGDRVLVGRVTGEVEAGRENDPAARRKLFDLDGPVNALALARDLRAAGADRTGRVRVERSVDGAAATWSAGGPVVLLAFAEAPPETGGESVLVAVREDGVLVGGPSRDGAAPRVIARLGEAVRAATVAKSGGIAVSVVPRLVLRLATDVYDVIVVVGPPLD